MRTETARLFGAAVIGFLPSTLGLTLAVAVQAAVSAAPVQAAEPRMQCSIGPLKKNFGGTDWVVYSCSDKKTVVIYTAAANPGKEFYFMLFPQGDKLRIYGEGNGDRQYTDAAFKELERMMLRDAAELIGETEVVGQAPGPAR